jgi:hypothetical protein
LLVAYTITLSDGTVLTTIPDNLVDTTTTSLALLGRNFAGYGGYVAEDFVHLLENFAGASPPDVPLVGQLFYNKGLSLLQMWNGTAWVNAGFPSDGVLKNTDVKIQDGALYITNSACPAGQQTWRIRVSNTAPYIGMLVFEALNANGSVRNTVMALDGVANLIRGTATAALYS